MKRGKIILGLLIMLISINFVFAAWCNDTDGGRVYNIKGNTFDSTGMNKWDNCSGPYLIEYFCVNNKVNGTLYNCGTGKICSNGACVNQTCIPNCNGKVCGPNGCGGSCGTCSGSTPICKVDGSQCIASWCNDTDGGLNYNQNGIVSGANSQSSWSGQQDLCSGNNLYERYCSFINGQYYLRTQTFACPYGCNPALSACNPSSWCNDTDGGRVYNIKGNTFDSTGMNKWDNCSGPYLIEYFCVNNKVNGTLYNCGTGKICSNGACMNATLTGLATLNSSSGVSLGIITIILVVIMAFLFLVKKKKR